MDLMTARTPTLQTRRVSVARGIRRARRVTSSAIRPISVSSHSGCATVTTIAVIIRTRTRPHAHSARAPPTASVAPTITAVFLRRGTATAMTTAATVSSSLIFVFYYCLLSFEITYKGKKRRILFKLFVIPDRANNTKSRVLLTFF